jgi:hypothetical protein
MTNNGLLSFPFTIRNQFVTTLSTLEGAKNLRKDFLNWQREFYKQSKEEAAAASIKAYVYGDEKDKTKTAIFTQMLLRHQVEVYQLKNNMTADGQSFRQGESFVVPANQPQYKVIKTIFDKTLNYKDSLFYDITAWTMPLAYGIPYAQLGSDQFNPGLEGNQVTQVSQATGGVTGKTEIGYLMEWNDLNAPAALYEAENNGLVAKVATGKFDLGINGGQKNFSYGTILFPVNQQSLNKEKISQVLNDIGKKYGLTVYGVQSGNASAGIDLGSSRFMPVTKPVIAKLTGTGVNATDAGEIWHLLDQRMNIPSTHLEITTFNRADLNKYNTILLVGGNYADLNKDKLKTWVQSGGVLVLTEEAVSWAAQNGIAEVKFKRVKNPVDSTQKLSYTSREQIEGAQQVFGAIFGADIDPAHPLAFGYNQKTVSLFKANRVFMEKSKSPYATPFYYGNNPLQSGWVSKENFDAIRNSAAVIVNTVGSGRVISIADNPNFRAFWLGGTKLFMNAIFFGRNIDAASARTEE